MVDVEGYSFTNHVNAVTDLGMDNNGNASISNILESVSDDTLIDFPDGQYLCTKEAILTQDILGFRGLGENVSFVVPANFDDRFVNTTSSHQTFLMLDIDVDQTASDACTGMRVISSEGKIKNVEFVGRGNVSGTPDGTDMLTVSCTTAGNTFYVENLVAKKNRWDNYTGGARIGIYVGTNHVEGATLEVRNCDFREFPNNAMYTSRTPGNIQVYDTYFENNNAAACRIGGDGSFAERCTFVVDPALYTGPITGGDQQMTMVVIEENFTNIGIQKPAGAYVKDCDFRYEEISGEHGSCIEVYSNGRSLDVINCNFEYNSDGAQAAIERHDYGPRGSNNNPAGEPPRYLRLNNCVIKGTGNIPTVVEIIDGHGSEFNSSCIEWNVNNPDGITYQDTWSNGITMSATISNSNINVPGTTYVPNNCNITVTSLTTGETCTFIDTGSGGGGGTPSIDINRGATIDTRGALIDGRGKTV